MVKNDRKSREMQKCKFRKINFVFGNKNQFGNKSTSSNEETKQSRSQTDLMILDHSASFITTDQQVRGADVSFQNKSTMTGTTVCA